jgi:hypothetical protein
MMTKIFSLDCVKSLAVTPTVVIPNTPTVVIPKSFKKKKKKKKEEKNGQKDGF